ncbi:luciferin sulfotransferase-like [Onthophagus taurus]|uniref:luciferin sulfotransferase-like n=1 Tax=Onthophagus taurus TaxID=166361 RepID=UPI000C204951|nr:sulfotransferase 1 family member D1-like [Onthophagus taurus]
MSNYVIANCIDFDGVKLPESFKQVRKEIEDFEVRQNDVWVTSYSKCGTTWCQELVWLVCNNMDYEGAKKHLEIRFPFIEYSSVALAVGQFIEDNNIKSDYSDHKTFPNPIKLLEDDEKVRYIKSHLPWNFLPKQIVNGIKTPKIIHVIRNPKQVVLSYYHHATNIFPVFKGSLNQFVDAYIKGEVLYGDYFTTVLPYLEQKHRENLLIITYEEMSSDLIGVINKVSKFMNKSYSDEAIKELAKHLSFDQMKENRAVNKSDFVKNESVKFIRKGKSDSYKSELDEEMIKKLDDWIEKSTKGVDFLYKN